MQTKLKISQAGFPPMSMGNCAQVILPLKPDHVWRSINGDALVSKTGVQKKYKTKIYGEDVNLPCFDGIHADSIVEVDSIQRVWNFVPADYEKAISLSHVPVAGSIVSITKNRIPYDLEQTDVKEFVLKDGPIAEDIFIGYCPKFTMVVTNLKVSHEEWEGNYKWELEAEEL